MVATILSIGTGHPRTISLTHSPMLQTLKQMAEDSMATYGCLPPFQCRCLHQKLPQSHSYKNASRQSSFCDCERHSLVIISVRIVPIGRSSSNPHLPQILCPAVIARRRMMTSQGSSSAHTIHGCMPNLPLAIATVPIPIASGVTGVVGSPEIAIAFRVIKCLLNRRPMAPDEAGDVNFETYPPNPEAPIICA